MVSKPELIVREDLPKIDLARGMHSCWVVSLERNGADQINMGICKHEANMDDLVWDQAYDEVFYCARGKLRLLYDDGKGNKGDLVANEGEVLFAPRGYHYILRATGVESINVYAHGAHTLDFSKEYSESLQKSSVPHITKMPEIRASQPESRQ
jgi:homogentisate 1,2-dioxygenase